MNNIIFEINQVCNNNCIYCYLPDKNKVKIENDNFLIQKIKEYSKNNNVEFTGGEPTLNKHLIKYIQISKKENPKSITLVTNGRLLSSNKNVELLKKAGVTRIIISLDSYNASKNDEITKTPGSFNQLTQACENIKNNDIELGITIVVHKLNYLDLELIINSAIKKGAHFISIQSLLPYIQDELITCRKIDNNLLLDYKKLGEIIDLNVNKFKDIIKINVYFIPYCFMSNKESIVSIKELMDRKIVHFQNFEYNIGTHLMKGNIFLDKCNNCEFKLDCCGFSKDNINYLGVSNEK